MMKHILIQKKLIAWLFVAIWMGVIFYLSHQSGATSSKLSSGFMNIIVQTFTLLFPFEINVENFHFLIRKGAHFCAYFILGILVMNALYGSRNKKVETIIASSICIIYAITDEFHQLFIPGRSGEVMDVVIDSCGSTIGIGLFLIAKKFSLIKKSKLS